MKSKSLLILLITIIVIAGLAAVSVLGVGSKKATALKTANRQKHKPLNESYSLDKNIFEDDEEATYIEMLKSRTNESPENKYIDDESKRMLEENVMANLSAMEKKVLSLYLKGKKYTEIAIIVEKDEKSIDNALQRIKKKISKIVAERQ